MKRSLNRDPDPATAYAGIFPSQCDRTTLHSCRGSSSMFGVLITEYFSFLQFPRHENIFNTRVHRQRSHILPKVSWK